MIEAKALLALLQVLVLFYDNQKILKLYEKTSSYKVEVQDKSKRQ